MTRPKRTSQDGRILALLEAHAGEKVPLSMILDLRPRISQYSRAIHTLRHKYGFRIENGCDEGRPDWTWFRLLEPITSSHHSLAVSGQRTSNSDTNVPGLFPTAELERIARWEDQG